MKQLSIPLVAGIALLGSLVACKKDAPKPAAPETTQSAQTEAPAQEPDAAAQVAISPTPAAPDAPAEEVKPSGDADTAPPTEEGEGVTTETSAAGSTESKPAAESEEPASETKKPSKKKGAEKAEDEPAKEAKPKFTELGIEVTKDGKGVAATAGRRVTLHYKASVADAEKPFDSTYTSNRPIEVQLGTGAKLPVIEGLRLGLEGLMPGSAVRLQIPASMAWGEKGNPAVGVPANSDVVFEVEVLAVQ